MFLIDRQVVRLQRGYRIIESVNGQAGAADKLFRSGKLRRSQYIVGDSDVVVETLGVPDGVSELPALRFSIETGFGVRKALSRKIHDAFDAFEIVEQRMRSSEIGRIGRTNAFSWLDSVDHRDLMPMGEKLAHDELSQPPRASCDDNAHVSASRRAKPAVLFQLFQQTVVDKLAGLGFARFLAGRAFENLINALNSNVGNPIAAIAHAVGLMQLRQSLGVRHLGIF